MNKIRVGFIIFSIVLLIAAAILLIMSIPDMEHIVVAGDGSLYYVSNKSPHSHIPVTISNYDPTNKYIHTMYGTFLSGEAYCLIYAIPVVMLITGVGILAYISHAWWKLVNHEKKVSTAMSRKNHHERLIGNTPA